MASKTLALFVLFSSIQNINRWLSYKYSSLFQPVLTTYLLAFTKLNKLMVNRLSTFNMSIPITNISKTTEQDKMTANLDLAAQSYLENVLSLT